MHGPAALALILTLSLSASLRAGQVGSSVEVAPKAEGTRSQLLASAAWCEGAKMWLVAWREGYLNEDASDIWCARFSADGRALDPAGVRLTEGLGLKSRPAVASDGKGFLVVWEDFRNGKDWDVYGAAVSADGKSAAKNGFLVAGGEHNQMRPDVTFCKGSYLVAWMGFTKAYGIYGVRVSGDGKLQDSAPQALALPAGNDHVITPALGANAEALLLAMTPLRVQYSGSCLAVKALDASSGKPVGSSQAPSANAPVAAPNCLGGESVRSPAIAVGKGEAIIAIYCPSPRAAVLVFRSDMSGAIAAKGPSVGSPRLHGQHHGALSVGSPSAPSDRQGLAFDGTNYLLVADCAEKTSSIKGWVVASDGKPGAEFLVSEGSAANCLSPAAAAGPAGSVLVVYSEVRGADDTKVVARVVK
jgi:hypothetical protein